MKNRKELLLSSNSSVQLTKKLINKITNEKIIDKPKILVFSESISHIESICDNTVHSGKKLEENKDIIHDFSKANTGILGACKGLTVGVTLPGVNCGIYSSYFSSRRNASQRIGRTIRDAKADIANNFYLVAKNTQQVEWLKTMLQDVDRKYIKKFEI